jgi:23S rRNA pseudouridine2604 synthase
MEELKRINKYISESGFCSRRGADRLIEDGLVFVNGEKAELGTKVAESEEVKVDGKLIGVKDERVYLAFNKPVGITCTTDLRDPDNIIDFINYKERIFPIGRLDKMSEGLIFLTNDGDIVNKILRSGNEHEKEYVVKVDLEVNGEFVNKMSSGVKILDTVTQPCRVEKTRKNEFRITLTEGLNRQIRRMCEVFGYKVLRLKRVRIMNVELGNIEVGTWRYLTAKEFNEIMDLVKLSKKGFED